MSHTESLGYPVSLLGSVSFGLLSGDHNPEASLKLLISSSMLPLGCWAPPATGTTVLSCDSSQLLAFSREQLLIESAMHFTSFSLTSSESASLSSSGEEALPAFFLSPLPSQVKRLKSLDLILPSLLDLLTTTIGWDAAAAFAVFVTTVVLDLVTAFSYFSWTLFYSLRCLLRL